LLFSRFTFIELQTFSRTDFLIQQVSAGEVFQSWIPSRQERRQRIVWKRT
jgi:hypothetical protein